MSDVMDPQEIEDVEAVFPASVIRLMPAWEDIPDEYKIRRNNWANRFAADWFFTGIAEYTIPWKEGIDQGTALRHLKTIQGSFEPKHEHKEAAIAYLLDSWTDGKATWTPNKPPERR